MSAQPEYIEGGYHRLPETPSPSGSPKHLASPFDGQRHWTWPQHDNHQSNPPSKSSWHGSAEPNLTINVVGSPTSSSHKRDSPKGHRKAAAAKPSHPRESRARRSSWLVINDSGIKTTIFSDKRGIIQKFKLGIPIRDMRLLDPNLLTSDTGKILVRDNAIVFSMEHVRLIITANCVIIPHGGFDQSPLATRFNSLLEDSIIEAAQEAQAGSARERERERFRDREDEESEVDRLSDDSSGFRHEVAPLPFELQVLEVALGDVCQLASQLTKELEAVGHPALDALTKHVSTANLERVRKVKTRHQRLTTRVVTVREELQRFLEDDDDMMKMCLTRKRCLEHATSSSGHLHNLPHLGSLPRRSLSLADRARYSATPGSPTVQPDTARGEAAGLPPEDETESIEAVENLLESYFMQIDGTFDRVVSIGEYIKDTEEYINIELDSSRNRLIRFEIILTAGTFGVAIFSLVAGILGENLIIPEAITQDVRGFFAVNTVVLAFCLLVFFATMGYIRWRRLM